MRHQQPEFESRDATALTVRDGSTVEVCEAVIAASLGTDDPAWVEALCVDLARNHNDRDVQGAAILGLAHLARRFGSLRDLAAVTSLLAGLEDVPELAGRVDDVRGDLRTFIST